MQVFLQMWLSALHWTATSNTIPLVVSVLTFLVAVVTVVIAFFTLLSQSRAEVSQSETEQLQKETKKIIEAMLQVQQHIERRDIEARRHRARSAVLLLHAMVHQTCNGNIMTLSTIEGWHTETTYLPDTCELKDRINDVFPKLQATVQVQTSGTIIIQSTTRNELLTLRQDLDALERQAHEQIDKTFRL